MIIAYLWLSFSDLTLASDHAVARHLARSYPGAGLYGKTALEASEVSFRPRSAPAPNVQRCN